MLRHLRELFVDLLLIITLILGLIALYRAFVPGEQGAADSLYEETHADWA